MKFKVNIVTTSSNVATYVIEAKDREDIYEKLNNWSVEDLGTCIKERELDYEERIDSVKEIKEDSNE